VLELIGLLVMLVFDFILGPAARIDIQGRLAFIQNGGVTYQTEQCQKERPPSGSFQLTLRHFSSAD
jgi:hypothetical protein